MPEKTREKWRRPFNWPPSTWEFTPAMQTASEIALALLLVFCIGTVVAAAILWPLLIYKTFENLWAGSADDVRNTLLAVAALIGVPFLIWRTIIAANQANIGRESHYTALFTKAVEQLGADKVVKKRDFKPHYERDSNGNILKDPKGNAIQKLSETGEVSGEFASYEVTTTNYEVRLGAIYALERIAQDSNRDAWPIYLTLCSYVQNNAEPRRTGTSDIDVPTRNNSDIEEIFNVLERYKGKREGGVFAYFEGVHLPDLRFLSGEFRQAVFSNCSVKSITLHGGAEAIFFENCSSNSFDARQAVLKSVVLREGSYKGIVVNDCSWENPYVDIKSDRVMLLSSDFTQGRMNFDSKQLIISESNFEDIKFGAEETFDPKPWQVRQCTFKHCTFIEVNFEGSDLEGTEFNSCQFVRCNFVRSRGLVSDGNEFVYCFTDKDYVPGACQPQFPHLDLQLQWSAWNREHRYHE